MIRQLHAGERIPEGEPRRYKAGHGYVRLRWRVGKGEYVEVYEHRVRDGVVVDLHVHHLDHVKDHNNPSNLVVLTQAEHMRVHHGQSIPIDEARELYLKGWTPAQLGKRYDLAGWTVTRYLRAAGVPMRGYHAGNKVDLDLNVIRDLHGQGVRPEAIAKRLGLTSAEPVRRAFRELGLASFPAGRPHANPSAAKARGFIR